MENAFKNLATGIARAADNVLLGGAVTKNQRRNAFANLTQAGDFQGAAEFATRHGRDDLAQLSLQRGQQQAQQQAAAQQAEQQKQAAQTQRLVDLAFALDQVPAGQRSDVLQGLIPVFEDQGLFDPEDSANLLQAAQIEGGLSAFAQSSLGVQQQFDNRLDVRQQGETERTALAGEQNTAFANETGRINAQTNRQNANTQAQNAQLDQQRGGGKLSEGERKFATFGKIAEQANASLVDIEQSEGFDPTLVQPNQLNLNRNPKGQAYIAAKQQFIDAIIRPFTGAAVTEFEFKSAERRFFPALGDDPSTIKFKRQLRQDALDAVKAGSGGAFTRLFPESERPATDGSLPQTGGIDFSQSSDDDLLTILGGG